ncbi:putative integral membrane protein [Rhodovulum bhavnagarense]|uniref:Putative integral membrane protein n=1 Tax=Rhodovulum bhavnagarense TaxID=992286 RepID=A0A4R2RKH1_9RHOB|nr:lipopolysaccharide assembly protein LapA domain-containing protein [Rhodovulum bhavnagarense]TCP63039.1 putative integral membrane protein [Rhodovulum bhavnagarense]
MRYIRLLFLLVLALCLVVVAMANNVMVTLTLLPQELATFSGVSQSIDLPLYVVGFGGVLVGLLVGFIWEWMRESKYRSTASRQKRENAKLKRELDKVNAEKHRNEGRDEVLALVEK